MEEERPRSLTEEDFYGIPGAEAVQILSDRQYIHDGRTLLEQLNVSIGIRRIGNDINPEHVAKMKFQKIGNEELAVLIEVRTEKVKPVLYLFILDLHGSITCVACTTKGNNFDVGTTGCSRYVSMIGLINAYVTHGITSEIPGIKYTYPSTTFHRGVQVFVENVFRNIAAPIRFVS